MMRDALSATVFAGLWLAAGSGLSLAQGDAGFASFDAGLAHPPQLAVASGGQIPFDDAQLLIVGMNAVKGDTSKRAEIVKAMEGAKIDSPRGALALNKGHNPIHDIYLRKVEGKENKAIGVAFKNLADPAVGCKM